MPDRPRPYAVTAGWIAAGAVGLALGAGGAQAAASSPSPAPGTAATAAPNSTRHHAHRAGQPARRRALHGTVVVSHRGKPVTVAFQRGLVTVAGATAVTVRSSDGYTHTYRVTATTRVRRDGAVAASGALTAGDRVFVRARLDGGRETAVALRAHSRPKGP